MFEALDPAATALVAADAQPPMGDAAGASAPGREQALGSAFDAAAVAVGNIGAIALSGALKIWIAAAC